jgi:hypothetical protein
MFATPLEQRFNMKCRGPKVGDTMFLIGNASGKAQMT